MNDEKIGYVPSYDALMSTYKRWVLSLKDIGIPKAMKDACRAQFQRLILIQTEEEKNIAPEHERGGHSCW